MFNLSLIRYTAWRMKWKHFHKKQQTCLCDDNSIFVIGQKYMSKTSNSGLLTIPGCKLPLIWWTGCSASSAENVRFFRGIQQNFPRTTTTTKKAFLRPRQRSLAVKNHGHTVL